MTSFPLREIHVTFHVMLLLHNYFRHISVSWLLFHKLRLLVVLLSIMFPNSRTNTNTHVD